MAKTYLHIESISDGQFPSECAIVLCNYKNEQKSGFFQRRFIRDDKLEVKIIDRIDDKVLVQLPDQILEGKGGYYITVNANDIYLE